jgi:hypothetical protein
MWHFVLIFFFFQNKVPRRTLCIKCAYEILLLKLAEVISSYNILFIYIYIFISPKIKLIAYAN